MPWSIEKLDRFEADLLEDVIVGLGSKDQAAKEDAERLGYWYYKLRDCKVAA